MSEFIRLVRARFSLRDAAAFLVIMGIVALVFDTSAATFLSIMAVIAAIHLGYAFADARGFDRDVVSLGVMLLATAITAVIVVTESVGFSYYALLVVGVLGSVYLTSSVFGGNPSAS